MKKGLIIIAIAGFLACNETNKRLSSADSTKIADSIRAAADAAAQLKILLDSAGNDVRMKVDTAHQTLQNK